MASRHVNIINVFHLIVFVNLFYTWPATKAENLTLPENTTVFNEGDLLDVVIFPLDKTTVRSVDQTLSSIIKDSTKISTIKSIHRLDFLGIECWRVHVDEGTLENFKTTVGEGSVDIVLNSKAAEPQLLKERRTNLSIPLQGPGLEDEVLTSMQEDAPDDLKVISWPPGKQFSDLKGFRFPSTKIPVHPHRQWPVKMYIIDNGYDSISSDFPPDLRPKWESPPGFHLRRKDESTDWHGTCVTAKAAGRENGVFKLPQVAVMLKSSLSTFDTL
ncbi:hypothetical protein ACLMJK_007995 [Lecanora helva]